MVVVGMPREGVVLPFLVFLEYYSSQKEIKLRKVAASAHQNPMIFSLVSFCFFSWVSRVSHCSSDNTEHTSRIKGFRHNTGIHKHPCAMNNSLGGQEQSLELKKQTKLQGKYRQAF